MTTTRTFAIYIRDANGDRIGEANELSLFTLTDRHYAAGTWEMRMPWSHPARALLWQPGHGIEVERTITVDGDSTTTVVASGDLRTGRRDKADADVATLYGATDLARLARRRAHPQPLTPSPPYNFQAYDVRTGPTETVIKEFVELNATVTFTERTIPGLTIATDLARGSTTTAQARWQRLDEFVLGLARREGWGLRVVALEFDIVVPTDRSADGVEFSLDRGNLGAFSYVLRAPEATFVYAGGSGTGTGRTIRENQDSAAAIGWGRAETFIDRRDTADATDLLGSIAEELATTAATSSLACTVIDTPTCTYGVHYELGDIVGVDIDGTLTAQPITELTLTIGQGGTTVRPVVGEADLLPGTLTLLRRLSAVEADVSDLQRYE